MEGVSCAKPRRQSSTLGNSSFANHSLANEDPAVGEGRLGVKKNILMMKPFGRCQLERILLQPAIMRDTVHPVVTPYWEGKGWQPQMKIGTN